jgi:hypothetical protein
MCFRKGLALKARKNVGPRENGRLFIGIIPPTPEYASVAPSALGAFLYGIPRPRGLSLGYNISPLRGSTSVCPFHSLHLRNSRSDSCPFVVFFCAFAATPFSRSAGEAVGGPNLGADTVVYEEKAGGIVFFFDGF